MTEQMTSTTWLALFEEVDPATHALDVLRGEGLAEEDMVVLSGIPFPPSVLGRPMLWERLPIIALAGAFVGFLVGVLLTVVTPLTYPIRVGGQPIVSIPPALVLTYEFTMMGLIVSTFLGVLWESAFPSFGTKHYDPKIADGKVGVLFKCPLEKQNPLLEELRTLGAELVQPKEWTL